MADAGTSLDDRDEAEESEHGTLPETGLGLGRTRFSVPYKTNTCFECSCVPIYFVLHPCLREKQRRVGHISRDAEIGVLSVLDFAELNRVN